MRMCTVKGYGKMTIPVKELAGFKANGVQLLVLSIRLLLIKNEVFHFCLLQGASSGCGVLWCPVPMALAVVLPGKGGHGSCWVSGQVSATILWSNGCVSGADPYVLIKCENQKVRSPVQHNTTRATFDTQVIFYRKNIDSPIIVQVR